MKYDKPDMTQGIWAESGTLAAVDPEKIALGWEVEKPPFEQANYVENRQDNGIAYVLQQGIPEWDAYTKYQTTSFVQYNGVVYKSLALNDDVLNKQPNTNPTYWQIAFTSFGDFLTIARATANGIDADLGVTNEVGDADFNTLTDVGVNSVTLSSTHSPYPNFTGVVETRVSSGIIYQIAQGKNTINSGWATRYYDGATWQEWVLYATKTDIETIGVTTGSLQAQISVLSSALTAAIEALKIPVGSLYFNAANTDPSVLLGYGAWVRYAEGKALVGFSSDPTSGTPDWCKSPNNTFGEYTHLQTVGEMPSHQHAVEEGATQGVTSTVFNGHTSGDDYTATVAGYSNSTATGGGTAMNIVQPSMIICVWRRIT